MVVLARVEFRLRSFYLTKSAGPGFSGRAQEAFMAKVTDTVAQLALPFAEAAGCTLWDVEYVKEAGEWFPSSLHRQGGRRLHRRLRGGLPPPVRQAGRGRPHRGQLHLRGVLRRGGPGAEEAGALRPVPGGRGGGPAVSRPGGPQRLCGAAPVLGQRRRGPGGGRRAP